MKALVLHFYGGNDNPPCDGAVMIKPRGEYAPEWEVEINDLAGWIAKHNGNVIVSPPGCSPYKDRWFIWVTDSSNQFKQK